MKDELLKIAMESMSDEEVKEIVKAKFKKMVEDAIESAFRWGDAEKAIKNKVTEVMVPYIEQYDFSEYLPKLDTVLTEIVNSSNCMAEKKILENFKFLSTEPDVKEMNISDIFSAWVEYCEKNIDTYDLDVNCDDGPHYESVECSMSVALEDKPSWSFFQYATVTFENEHDEDLNIQFRISQHNKEPYKISFSEDTNIRSLRLLDDFKLLLMRLTRANTNIILDTYGDDGEIFPEEEPEASFS